MAGNLQLDYLLNLLTCRCSHKVDPDLFRGLFTYAVIETTTQATHVNSLMPSIQNTTGTLWYGNRAGNSVGAIIHRAH